MENPNSDLDHVPNTGPIREIGSDLAMRFPRHGSAKIGEYYGLLFPVLSAFRNARIRRAALGAPERPNEKIFPASYVPFRESLHQVAVCLGMLRELEQGFPVNYLSERSPEKDLAASRAFDRGPVLLTAALHQLKVCGNRFARGAGALLFAKTGQDRKRLQDLQKDVLDQAHFSRLGPLVSPLEAARVFRDHCGWFFSVADSKDKRGLREMVEHDLTTIDSMFTVSSDSVTGVKDGRLIATITSRHERVHDILARLQATCRDMCIFFEEICKLIDHSGGYVYEDAMGVSGVGTDGVYYWPTI